ncbi:zinc ABC transporter substrate-binding protein [Xylanimonas oleitrophica]|uniref:Zinc ABC transporter substrate-binding protein n=1 Tax=Xylanimonas oleitrophica TaxID=2607479 RepID=A0A2W5WSR5_9MICO|nr:zinc ABC transporter substrate-binding protein [Xylanimonas oleitrophica]PZR53683.1 zinc ABC transporter substrate-binding protein [Xylanimonas oleitrophica]
MPRRRSALLAVPALALPLALAACGSPGGSPDDDRVHVLASFYPLQYVAQEVGGDHVRVENLTPPAAEPHDLELSPAQVRQIGTADLVLYLSGFQAAVDEGVRARDPEHVVDAADVVTLVAHASATGSDDGDHGDHGHDADEDHGDHGHDADEDHADHEHADEHADDGHDHGSTDPHFWLDPTLLARLAEPVADELSAVDPDNADEYAAGAQALQERLGELDAELAAGLAPFQGATVVTSHTAFGYLADRYGLRQVGISELDPEAEPSPARLREIGAVVRERGVTTLFSETLVSPKVTETLAADLGVSTAVLDPLEGLSQDAAASGEDYVTVMQRNLEALEQGLVAP